MTKNKNNINKKKFFLNYINTIIWRKYCWKGYL